MLIVIIYPSKNENAEIYDYCYCFEKILSRNSIKNRKNMSQKNKIISKDFAKLGVAKTKGVLIKKIIEKYKSSKDIFLISIFPNEIYCLSGYWIEKLRPGTFESIIYKEGKKRIYELKNIKDEVNLLINDINSEYKFIKKELNIFFK